MKQLIEVIDLSAVIGNFNLKEITFSIPINRIVALVGGNGSGKSVLLKTLLNIIQPNQGEVFFFNESLNKKEREIKERIGIVFDDGYFYEQLTIAQMTEILSGGYKNWDPLMFTDYLGKFDLTEELLIKNLSKGMKMKYALAVALSHQAEVFILDEPTNGLDLNIRNEILSILKDEIGATGKTIIFSTHLAADIETLADDILFMKAGRLIFQGTLDTFKHNHKVTETHSLEAVLTELVGKGGDRP